MIKNAKNYSAAILVIGNEILSGRTKDKNINFIAERCTKIGIDLREVRVIEDDKKEIIANVKVLSEKFDYLFTTGGIGPTHDDKTADSIAEAFEDKLVLNTIAHDLLKKHYEKSSVILNESRLKMAYIPSKASLIKNSVSAAPGFKLNNVWVMAGVPKIMQAMFLDDVEKSLKKGSKTHSLNITVLLPEGDIAEDLEKVQNSFKAVEIGSYPFYRPPEIGTVVVLRGKSIKTIKNAIKVLCKIFTKAKIPYLLD